ncbi:MAG: hypothetical protein JWO87_289 [Phycisphaerales bacterium]|jgi:hypothetical protein|nr:hypothetical protein [Phycisphaerales bacterium]
MSLSRPRLMQFILRHLAQHEMRLLVLVVAIRKDLHRSEGIKGDLSELVKSILRELVASKVVVDVDGMYALS